MLQVAVWGETEPLRFLSLGIENNQVIGHLLDPGFGFFLELLPGR